MPRDQKERLRVQYGALPYRWNDAGELEVLLITSRQRRRWIMPKGWPIKGLSGWRAAEVEAREEAGVCGDISRRAAGRFEYDKLIDDEDRVVRCEVTVYPLLVTRTLARWREQAQRESRWLSPQQAVAIAADPGLRDVIAAFAAIVQTTRR